MSIGRVFGGRYMGLGNVFWGVVLIFVFFLMFLVSVMFL